MFEFGRRKKFIGFDKKSGYIIFSPFHPLETWKFPLTNIKNSCHCLIKKEQAKNCEFYLHVDMASNSSCYFFLFQWDLLFPKKVQRNKTTRDEFSSPWFLLLMLLFVQFFMCILVFQMQKKPSTLEIWLCSGEWPI